MVKARYYYQAYGLCIESNFPLALDSSRGLGNCEPDLSVLFCDDTANEALLESDSPWYVGPFLTSDGQPNSIIYRSCVDEQHVYTFTFADGVTINYAPLTGLIAAFWPPNYTAEDAVIYVTGPVLAFALKLNGALTLHASAVNVRGSAVLFVGPSGMGKSTTAAAFAKRGYPIITDDLAVIRRESGDYWVEPGLARLCVWPNALEALFGTSDSRYQSISPNDPSWDKRYLKLDGLALRSQELSLPVKRIYVLERQPHQREEVRFSTLPSREAFMSLVTHAYGFYWPLHKARMMEFRTLAGFPSAFPVRKLVFPDNLSQLDRLVDEVRADLLSTPNLEADN